MRSTTPSHRRLRSRPPRHGTLDAIARVVDQASVDDPGHVVVFVRHDPGDHLALGLRSIDTDVHPFEELAGVVAPPEWWAFGLRVRGRATVLDEPESRPQHVANTFLVSRDGQEASLLRGADDDPQALRGPAEGTIPDLCRRILDLPTAPPPLGTAVLWTTLWLDRLLDACGTPQVRSQLRTQLDLLRHHPATDGEHVFEAAEPDAVRQAVAKARAHADAWPWSRLRLHPAVLDLPAGDLPPDVAGWMDDGFYARWTLGGYPSLPTLMEEVRALVGESLGEQLTATVVELLE